METSLNYFLFETSDVNVALHELLAIGLTDYSIIEDKETAIHMIGGLLPCNTDFSNITFAKPKAIETDMWLKQWEAFAPDFYDGMAHIHLKQYGGPTATFVMQPGAGFGDLSHPTTQLCLRFLCNMNLHHKTVVDIGCGSGVLSIAAAKMGCTRVFSIDIDDDAIAHTKRNLLLNDLPDITVQSTLPIIEDDHPIILMNMTYLEQLQVLDAHPILSSIKADWIISGILESQEHQYSNVFSFLHILHKKKISPWVGLSCKHHSICSPKS
ncbi:MAG: 50S ribosomal protein L11 methyltransferase [Chlamydiales bacterium]|nr:50S ribosomal protein L11 methyltransferase [Chlamydiales bacterium]